MIQWEIKAKEFTNCNCAYGCPCQFNALPTYGDCRAISGMIVEKGHFGDVPLDGVTCVGVMAWPGPIHLGGGKAFIIVDERATEAQRHAILTILSGQETEPGKTIWNVFAATLDEVYETEFRPIDISIDVERRRGRIEIHGLVETTGTPIFNPVTGAEHRARIDLPDGFEYLIAEMGSGSTKASGPIPLDLKDSYGQFAHIHLNQSGVVRT